jgi:hypothetical protein
LCGSGRRQPDSAHRHPAPRQFVALSRSKIV